MVCFRCVCGVSYLDLHYSPSELVKSNRENFHIQTGNDHFSPRRDLFLQFLEGKHFGWQVRLGRNGVEEVLELGSLSDYEQKGLEALKEELQSSIQKGLDFVKPQHT